METIDEHYILSKLNAGFSLVLPQPIYNSCPDKIRNHENVKINRPLMDMENYRVAKDK